MRKCKDRNFPLKEGVNIIDFSPHILADVTDIRLYANFGAKQQTVLVEQNEEIRPLYTETERYTNLQAGTDHFINLKHYLQSINSIDDANPSVTGWTVKISFKHSH